MDRMEIREAVYDLLVETARDHQEDEKDIVISQDIKAIIRRYPNEKPAPVNMINVLNVHIVNAVVLSSVRILRLLDEDMSMPKRQQYGLKKDRVLELLGQGQTDTEIMEIAGVSRSYVVQLKKLAKGKK